MVWSPRLRTSSPPGTRGSTRILSRPRLNTREPESALRLACPDRRNSDPASKASIMRIIHYVCCAWLCCALPPVSTSMAAQQSGTEPPRDEVPLDTASRLAYRQRSQMKAAAAQKAFHDFRFADRTAESGITFHSHCVDDVGKHNKPIHYDHGCGIAVADIDGDGLPDIYFVSQLGGNELWRNLGNGKFENITASAGVGLNDRICVGASFADVDNDGLPDLFVTTVRGGNVL